MATTIDALTIEIHSTSVNAAKGIDDLAKSLANLKSNGSFSTATKNLQKLSAELRSFTDASNATRSIGKLAGAIAHLKSVGSITSVGNSLRKLAESIKTLDGLNVDNLAPQIRQVVEAVTPLSQVKAGGLNTMMNALLKMGQVTKELSPEKIAAFAAKVELLNKTLEPLSTKMTTIQAGFRGINSQARSAGAAVEQMGEEVDGAMLNWASFVTVIQAAHAALQGVIQKVSEYINMASEWDGISARFGRGFGDQAQETYEWIQKLNAEMGINIQQFMQYSSVFSTMLTGFGVASEDARKMAVGYTELTYDIWAGYNDIYKSFDEAAEAVKSAIAGEVEPIRRAGFTIVEATLEQTAANHGLEISLANATEAQKSYLRYLTLVDQAHAQSLVGTYAKELNTAEGLMRTFSQQTKSLAQAFGSLFLPALVAVMPYIQAFINLLTEAVTWVAALFGIEIQAVDWSGYNAGAESIGEVADSADKATGALGGAAKAAKELKNATLGIDELNVISPPSATGGGGGGGGAGGGAGAGAGFGDLDIKSLWDDSIFADVNNQVKDIVARVKEWLGLNKEINSLSDLLDTRLGKILLVVAEIGAGLALWKLSTSFLNGLAWIENLKNLGLGGALNTALGVSLFIAGVVFDFIALKSAIENGLDGFNFVEIVVNSLIGTGGAAILGAKLAAWIDTAFSSSTLSLAITQAGINLGTGTAAATGAALAASISGIIFGLPAMFVGIYDACVNEIGWLNGALTAIGGAAAGAGVAGILTALGTTISPGIGTLIGLAVGLVVDGIILIIQKWDVITAFLSTFFTETVPNMWNTFVTWAKNLPQTIEQWFKGLWQPIQDFDWEGLGYDAGQWLGNAIKSAIDFVTVKVPAWFKETTKAMGEALDTFFTDTLPEWGKNVAEFMKGLPRQMVDAFNAYRNWRDEVGMAILNGIFEGLATFGLAVVKFVKGFVQGFKDALGIHSPSTVFAEIGKACVDGLKNAFSINAIKDKLVEMWNAAKKWWDETRGALKSYTPSIGAITTGLQDRWESAKEWWDKKKAGLKAYVPTMKSIYEPLKERWDNAKEWWDKKKSGLKSYTPSIGSIYEKVYDRWKNARDWWNGKKGSFKTYTPSIGSITDKLKSAWSSAKSWWSKNVSLSTKLDVKVPTIKVKWETASAFGKSFKYPTGFTLKFAAAGGIFDAGSLIWAGERGAEVVANAGGGKTGVMNVQQMSDAVYEGVYAAVIAAMQATKGGEEGRAVNVYLDGRLVGKGVEKAKRESGASIMGNEVYAY